jgi:hypothetical protein
VSDHTEDSLGGKTDKEFAHALQGKDFLNGDTVICSFDDDDARIEILSPTLRTYFICYFSELKLLISNAWYVEDLDPTVGGIVECRSLG